MNFTTFSTIGSAIGKTVGLSVVASLLMTACSSTETKDPFRRHTENGCGKRHDV